MRIVGAGLGRTGTHSLKLALERLLDAPCYHMSEVFEHLDHIPTWHAAIRGEAVDWKPVLGSYEAIVDWPGAAVWRELATAYPDAPVLLSTRKDAATWLKSARATILGNSPENKMEDDPSLPGFVPMARDMFARFEPDWRDDDAAMAAYDRHNAAVRREVPVGRLVEWQPGDGWGPLCEALGVPLPDEDFPHVNSTEEFQQHRRERQAAAAD
ncbi:MAG TPA: sulfotransferase [Mycobacteriales bacterium]|nr:sulfotransferase [Mycobacteriales bacterium]